MHKNTYKRLVKKLKESFPNMKTKADAVIDYNLKSAVEDSDVNQKALEDAIKMSEADKKFFMGDREAKRKISSPALKKLHLSEALFLNEAEDDQRKYWAKKACKLDDILNFMNNEEAYQSWLHIWPKGETVEDAIYDFGDEESYKELEHSFISTYKKYHDDGLYFDSGWYRQYTNYYDQIIADAHEWDKKLGLPEIEIIIDSSKSFNESLNEAELNRFGKKAARDEYRRYAAKKDAYSSAVNRVSDTMKKTGFDSMTPEEAVDEFGIAEKPVKPSNKIKNGRVEKRNFPYYVTVYYDDYVYNPEEGGYIDYGNDVVFSKGFNTKEEAQEYYTTHQYYNEDDYRMYIETNKTYLNLRDPAKTWAEREFGGKYSVRYADSDRFYNESLNKRPMRKPINEGKSTSMYAQCLKDINKAKSKLKAQSPRENFGDKEVRNLRDKYVYNSFDCDYFERTKILNAIDSFEDWCATYTFNESLRKRPIEESINRKSRKSTLNESIFNRKLSK